MGMSFDWDPSDILVETYVLGVDSPFFSTIVLLKNQLFVWVFDGLPEKKRPWKEWER